MSATDPQSLLSQAKCFTCFGISIAEALQLALLAEIVVNGSTGGGGGGGWQSGNYGGVAPPNTPPSSPFGAIDTNNNAFWIYFSGAWHNTGVQTG